MSLEKIDSILINRHRENFSCFTGLKINVLQLFPILNMVIQRSFIGPPIFFTGPPTFSLVEDRGLTSFAESDQSTSEYVMIYYITLVTVPSTVIDHFRGESCASSIEIMWGFSSFSSKCSVGKGWIGKIWNKNGLFYQYDQFCMSTQSSWGEGVARGGATRGGVLPHLAVIWVRSQNCGCLVTCFCYHLISKAGNKTVAVSWPDRYCFR